MATPQPPCAVCLVTLTVKKVFPDVQTEPLGFWFLKISKELRKRPSPKPIILSHRNFKMCKVKGSLINNIYQIEESMYDNFHPTKFTCMYYILASTPNLTIG